MPQKSKRIIIFTTAFHPFIGGSEIAIEDVTNQLSEFFFDIITPLRQKGLASYELRGNVAIHRLGFGSLIDKYIFPILGYLKGTQLIRKHNISILHAYQASHAAGAAWLIKLFHSSIFFILTLQEGKNLGKQSGFVKFFRSLILRRADLITSISHYLKSFAYQTAPHVPCLVIPNGVDLEKFSYAPDQAHKALTDKPVIMTISRLVSKNGLMELIDAFKIVRSEYPGARLQIIGEGPDRNNLELQIENLGLNDSVDLIGQKKHEEVPLYLNKADVFVRPSLSEGFGTAFLEAMARGVPVVATPVGGIPDFLIDGVTGIYCRPRDSQSIADSVIKILGDNNLRNSIIINAIDMVRLKYDIKIVANKFRNLYEQH